MRELKIKAKIYFHMKIVVNYLNLLFHIVVKTKSNDKFMNFVLQFIKNKKWHIGYMDYPKTQISTSWKVAAF